VPLDSVDQQKVLDFFQKHSLSLPECSFCKNKTWNIGDLLAAILVPSPPPEQINFLETKPALLVPISCSKCSNTIFFSALAMGIGAAPPSN